MSRQGGKKVLVGAEKEVVREQYERMKVGDIL